MTEEERQSVDPVADSTSEPPAYAIENWGTLPYSEALERQKRYVLERKAHQRPDTLIFVEHPPVFTIGARKDAAQHLIWDAGERARHNISLERTNRGGDVTYHGPGQLVGYIIADASGIRDLHATLRAMEDLLIHALIALGLPRPLRREGKTGIWIQDRKIAAIGLAVSSWITYHGFSLNICPDLQHFSGIIPCGITDGSVTSLARELDGPPPAPDTVQAQLSSQFPAFLTKIRPRA